MPDTYVEIIRALCKEKKIAVSTLERACGFSNGYLNPNKLKQIPYERAVKVAEYLGVPLDSIFPLSEKEKAPTQTGARQVTDDDIKYALFGGQPVTDEQFEEVKRFARYVRDRDIHST